MVKFRVLIAPATDQSTVEKSTGQLLMLQHPKSGVQTKFLFINEGLHELHWFKQSLGSWFLGDFVCEDGSLYTSTPVDPVFILLPIFKAARMKRKDDSGKFRQLDEIIFVDGCSGYQNLLKVAEKYMDIVCEVKEVGCTKFFRLDDSKVLAWLCAKVDRLKQTLFTLDKNYAAQDEKHTLAEAVSILAEYVRDDPWLERLCNHLRLNLQDVMRRAADACSPAPDDMIQSSTTRVKGEEVEPATNKKPTKNGRQTKKTKVENSSQNIKDMFSRATRSKTKVNSHIQGSH